MPAQLASGGPAADGLRLSAAYIRYDHQEEDPPVRSIAPIACLIGLLVMPPAVSGRQVIDDAPTPTLEPRPTTVVLLPLLDLAIRYAQTPSLLARSGRRLRQAAQISSPVTLPRLLRAWRGRW